MFEHLYSILASCPSGLCPCWPLINAPPPVTSFSVLKVQGHCAVTASGTYVMVSLRLPLFFIFLSGSVVLLVFEVVLPSVRFFRAKAGSRRAVPSSIAT